MSGIKNKITEAGLITLDIQDFVPNESRKEIDIADLLDDNFIVKEASFKKNLKNYNWKSFQNSFVAVFCSKDVIIPPWSYLLIQMKLSNIAKQVFFCDMKSMEVLIFQQSLSKININKYKNQRVFLKVCSGKKISLTNLSLCAHFLIPHVKSLFYGEPCSGVPLIKN